MKELRQLPESVEKEPAREVWIIEDNEEVSEEILKNWKNNLTGIEYFFKYFLTAREALDEIEKRKKEERKMPRIIFIDGNLELDKEELNKGVKVIDRIHSIKDIEQPFFVAHSSISKENEEMVGHGAGAAFIKGRVKESEMFLQDFES